MTDFPYGTSTTAQDTFASSKYPTSNFNTYQRPDSPYYYEMWHGNEPGTSYYNEVYMRFKDIRTTIGDYVHVDGAALQFYPYWQYYHSTPRKSYLRLVTQDWTVGQVTWNNRPTVASSDYSEFYTTQGQWSDEADVTDYVQDVINIAQNNNGFMIHANPNGQGNWKRIVSGNQTSPYLSLRPHLVVSWHRPTATPTTPVGGAPGSETLAWTYDNGDATYGTPQSDYWVQVATSNTFATIVRETTDGASGKWAAGNDASWTFPTSGPTMTYGNTYWWRVKVKDGVGQSEWSAPASFVYTAQVVADPMRGEEAFYTRVPFDLGAGWRMAVGVHNGELTIDKHLFDIPSYGPPQALSLSYSSQNPDSAYFGTGWSSNLTQHLTFDTGLVGWHRPDGGLVTFTLDGSTWTPPAGHFETLSATSGSTYTIITKDQMRYVFEDASAGRLERIENCFGNALTLDWNANDATATDASGRETDFVISGGLITSATDFGRTRVAIRLHLGSAGFDHRPRGRRIHARV